jgi:hypothetical protein
MKKEKEKIAVPKLYMNGEYIPATTPQQALGGLFEYIPNIECWSYEALREYYIGSIRMVCLWCQEMRQVISKKTPFTKFINQEKQMLLYVPKDHHGLLTRIYETMLVRDKLGTLPGFRISNTFGDNISGDPERQALRDTDCLT